MTVFIVLIAMLLTFSGALFIQRYAVLLGLIDVPNHRSSHVKPTPRGGGLAFASAYCLGLFFLQYWLDLNLPGLSIFFAGCVLMVGVGIWDDIKPISAKCRFMAQFFAVAGLFLSLGYFPPIAIGVYQIGQSFIYQSVVLIAFIWLINLYNFMDGIDGIAVLEAIFIAVSGILLLGYFAPHAVTLPLFILLAACMLAFLPLNWAPARLFMGDVGSNFIGYLLVFLIFLTVQEHSLTVWSWLIILGYFIVDTSFTLVRRLVARQCFYHAHRSHAYQILSRHWKSHAKMCHFVLLINVIWLLPLAILSQIYAHWGLFWVILAWLPMMGICYWAQAGKE